jgi:hypothetical protein
LPLLPCATLFLTAMVWIPKIHLWKFKTQWHHIDSTIINEISAFVKVTRELPLLFCHVKAHRQNHPWRRKPSLNTALVLSFPPSRTIGKKIYCVQGRTWCLKTVIIATWDIRRTWFEASLDKKWDWISTQKKLSMEGYACFIPAIWGHK